MALALLASQVPSLQTLPAVLNPEAANPTPAMASVLPAGTVPDHRTRFAANAVRIDALGRAGGGGIAILSGFDLTASGLVATLGAGGPGEVRFYSTKYQAAAMNVTGGLADGGGSVLYNYLWYSMQGTFDKTTSSDPDAPPGPPGSSPGPWCYLGRISTTGGAYTGIDTSGRPESRGGIIVRETADVGPPLDTPPAGMRYVAKARSGYYLWDLDHYQPLSVNRLPNVGAGALYAGAGEQLQFARKISVRTGGIVRARGAGALIRVRG